MVAVCLLVLQATTKPVGAAFAGKNGAIAYHSAPYDSRRTGSTLWQIDPNSFGKEQLTDLMPVYEPAWSADGTKIAFRLGRLLPSGGSPEKIYTMNVATNSSPVKLTPLEGRYHDPSWFPNGRKIAFESDKALPGNYDIYVQRVRSNGRPRGEPVRITTNDGHDPAVSPRGNLIAFSRYQNGAREIYVIRADAPEGPDNPARKIIDTTGECSASGDADPDWSPDGQMITYVGDGTCTAGIYVTATSGAREATRLATGRYPSFSPDGQKIAYWRESDGEVWVMDADGSNKVNLTGDGAQMWDREPTWQPLPDATTGTDG